MKGKVSDARAAAAEVQAFLMELVPPEDLEIRDVTGGLHRLPKIVSARATLRVTQALASANLEAVAFPAPGAFSIGAISRGVLSVLSSDEALDALGRAFTAAFPAVVQAARVNRQAIDIDGNFAPGEYDILDLFPVEELVVAIVPLFARPTARLASALAPPAP
jgi:hypothetical protein